MNRSRQKPPTDTESAARSSETRMRVARTGNQPSGQFPLHYLRVRETLLAYLSPILVDSVLEKAMRARHLTPSSLSPSALLEITSDIMVGLRDRGARQADPISLSLARRAMETIDARGKSCPLPIVLTAKAMRSVAAGELLTVQADDRAFPEDIRAWCRKTSHELLSLESKPGFYEAVVKKPA
jgi:tRNA 2-thiouridine synthesizing protein A